MKRFISLAAFTCALVLSSLSTNAHDGGSTYPRLAAYAGSVGNLTSAARDSLSWFDLLVLNTRPEWVQEMRKLNPKQTILRPLEPYYAQTIRPSFIVRDTLWSPSRALEWVAYKNDWYLKDVFGSYIEFGDGRLLNWTSHCRVGSYGSSKGLRLSEWYVQMLKRITQRSDWLYNGVMFEVCADCPCSYAPSNIVLADPDDDGIAEGCKLTACSGAGANSELANLWKAENTYFWIMLKEALPDLFILVNSGSVFNGPSWRVETDGVKLERWMQDGRSWWDWFYGGSVQAGYWWARSNLGTERNTIVCSYSTRTYSLGLGTCLLGDGLFLYSDWTNQRRIKWPIEFNRKLGIPRRPMKKYVVRTDTAWDTLYVRTFWGEDSSGVSVIVNPYPYSVGNLKPGTTFR